MPAVLPKPIRITSKPGIQRDGTELDRMFYTDGQWVRFQRGRPKKMGGYRAVSSSFTGPVRGVHTFSKQAQNIIHSMSSSKVEATLVDNNGLGSAIYDRTPVGFVTQTDYLWQIDTFFDLAGSNKTVIVAHPGRNLTNIDNNIATPVYFGDVSTTAALTTLGQSIDGGVLSIQPYLVLYGSNGEVRNSAANEVTNFSTGDANVANVASTKIVKGLPVRSAGQSPGAVLWSLDSVIRMTFIGPPQIFRFDTVSSQTSILSSASVIEYDGMFYWIGTDRFLMTNGATVQEIPNQLNLNWFFDNLNYDNRQKVWVTKVPRYGEIWWFYPRGTASECTHAVIFNVREQTWYDVELGRSAGYFSQVFRFPVLADSQLEADNIHVTLWQHEFGRDRVKGDVQLAIPSYFVTHDLGLPTGGPTGEQAGGADRWLRIERIEPDFIQSGDMTVSMLTREYPKSPLTTRATGTFSPTTEKVDFRAQGREIYLRFDQNSMGGFYEMGSVLVDVSEGDVRQ